MSRRVVVTTKGQDRLGLRALCERYMNDRWYAAHMTDKQAVEALLDQFKRAVAGELELLDARTRCER
jgi:hypothetical protein